MTKFTFRAAALAACLILGPALAAAAQTPTTISGTVTDAQGGALPGAAVVAVHIATGALVETTTDRTGEFALTVARADGPYAIKVTMPGFAVQERRDIVMRAGETTRVDFELSLATLQEAVTVTAGSALARDDKRAAGTIVDVVSADSMGRFPDANAAEALRRVPGVSLEIDQGEGRFVVVRGIDASLNNVTLNGQLIGTPAEFGTRGVSMDSVPADLIARLRVVKAVTPDMDANAIGASIDIQTLGPFDLPGGFFFGSLRSGYNDMSGRAPLTGSVSFGRVLDRAQRWGLVLGASYSRRRYDTELFRVSDGAWSNFNGFFVPQNQAFFLYDVNRRRQGVNAALEFRATRQHRITLRVNHNRFADTEGRQQTAYDLTRGTLSNQTATSGTFSQGRATREYRDYTQRHTINAVMLGARHDWARTNVDWNVAASRGERDTPNRVDWEFRSAANAFPNSYDVSDPDLVRVSPAESFYTATSYPFRRVRFRQDLEREDVVTGEVNVRRVLPLSRNTGFWKGGAKIVARDKTQDRSNQNYNAAGPEFTLADFGVGGSGPNDFFRGAFRFGPTLNLGGVQDFFHENPGRFAFDPVTSAQNSAEQDFTADERVVAGYGLLGFNFARGSVMTGVRVERTSADYSAGELVFANGAFTGRVNPATGETDYTDVMPGVHVSYFPTPRITVRAAWTHTLGRPAYADLAPISVLDEVQETDGSYSGSLSTGNARLEPYRSMNIDVSFEFYLEGGLLSIAPFHKQIDNPIYERKTTEENVVHNGRTYNRFGFSRPENAESGRISGVELNFQTTFTRLPSPFDGLGTNINYTFTDSSVSVFDRDDHLPFFKQSDHIGNAALLYSKSGVEAQVSLSFQSPALGSIGATAAADNYGDWYKPLDAKVSFPLARLLRGFVELRNLNDQPRIRYAGTPDRRTAHEIYSRDVYAGIDWRF